MVREIGATALAAWLADEARHKPCLLDVREPWEIERAAIAGSVAIPMHLIPMRMNELPDGPVVTICHHGVRSYQIALYLEKAGFDEVYSLAGGVEEWANSVDPTMARY
ncbi:rhodanese-like domain-containing protein [Crenobacter caeni]|uniref:Sulfurtransferase n=1 Tax=Crenobacter caeni TaxID=2705474 RepID=A0A6B2KVK7_9NEIS|nr:rhodanese-like domain-containing protein [Crenobacter caeni]NDV14178.1 sulfurtransferase [Crenobacter caeni]